jgi:hypothetical protein
MSVADIQLFLKRGRDFLEGMRLLGDDAEAYGYSSALLAIHGAISYCDALRAGLGDDKLASDDHSRSSDVLKKLLASRQYGKLEGIEKLSRILGSKSDVAYGRELTQVSKVKSLILQTERFVLWAEATGKELNIEGWTDE